MIKIDCPVFINLPRKTMPPRKVAINLNVYRNLHHQINNQVKDTFSEGMRRVLSDVKLKDELYITYKYYKGSNRRSDKNNVISIVDKFFCDSLVKYDIIPDDNDNIIISTHNHQTEIDKLNPRVEARLFNNKEDYIKDIIKNL